MSYRRDLELTDILASRLIGVSVSQNIASRLEGGSSRGGTELERVALPEYTDEGWHGYVPACLLWPSAKLKANRRIYFKPNGRGKTWKSSHWRW